VIFPDHDRLLEQVRGRLRSAGRGAPLAAACDAVRLVLAHYLAEGDLARLRYALTAAVPALREREIVAVARYQRLFREHIAGEHVTGQRIAGQHGDGAEPAALEAELMAAAVASAHNHVLRRWLRGESTDPLRELDDALGHVTALFAPRPQLPGDADGTTVVAFRTGRSLDSLLPALKDLIDPRLR
jgi:hypothetical protein